ncbi:MAG: isopentenyl phosphate kinase, partial [Chloroflexota bacterium]|nr:isopentenyl phosphate kinase [Chloroflexota bacterium]
KRQPETVRPDVLHQLAGEIAEARRRQPALRLVIGHGSGSFGHLHARRYGTRDGVQGTEAWLGFATVADAAARLNRLIATALLNAGVPVWTIQPCATLRCVDGQIVDGPLTAVREALKRGLVPLLYGDVALDSVRGGTIASTEEIFAWLALGLPPARLILLGEVDGIYSADPQLEPTAERLTAITPTLFQSIQAGLAGSYGVDVTGGMAAKVAQAMAMVRDHPALQVTIASGLVAGHLQHLLDGTNRQPNRQIGTRIYGE